MKKMLFCVLFMGFIFGCCTAFAAPLDDYGRAGNVGLSIRALYSDLREKDNYGATIDLDKKWNLGGEATVAVVPGWALSLAYAGDKSKHTVTTAVEISPGEYFTASDQLKLSTTNIKLKYEAYNKHGLFFAPYLGWARNKGKFYYSAAYDGNTFLSGSESSKSKNSFLAGFTAVYALTKDEKFKVYLDAGAGSKAHTVNLGFSYEIIKNFAFDCGYQYYKAKDLLVETVNEKLDCTNKGVYFGLSYSFK